MKKTFCFFLVAMHAFTAEANFGTINRNRTFAKLSPPSQTEGRPALESSAAFFVNGSQVCQLNIQDSNFQGPAFISIDRNPIASEIAVFDGVRACSNVESRYAYSASADAYLLNDAQMAALPLAIMGVACVVAGIHGAATANSTKENPVQSRAAGIGIGMVGGSLSTYFGATMAGGIGGVGAIWAAATICHVAGDRAIVFLSK